MIKSDWRGEALNIIPKRSISYRLTAACIISTAQQARPKVSGHREPARAQFISDKTLEVSHSTLIKYMLQSPEGPAHELSEANRAYNTVNRAAFYFTNNGGEVEHTSYS